MKTALVTGATGFVGGRLVRRLAQNGWHVHAMVRDGSSAEDIAPLCRLHRYSGSYADAVQAIAASVPDIVFHVASAVVVQHRPDQVDDILKANITLPLHLVEAMVAHGVSRIVNTGSSWQRAGSAAYLPMNLYAATKQAFQDLLLHYHLRDRISCINIELFDNYGENDPRRKLLNLMRNAVESGVPLDMTSGEQVMDLTHVEDVVSAYLAAADCLFSEGAEIFHTYSVSGERFSVKDIAAMVEERVGQGGVLRLGCLPYRKGEIMMPAEPMAPVPGWRRERSLKPDFIEKMDIGRAPTDAR